MGKEAKTRIKIMDLPRDQKISKAELKAVQGGLLPSRLSRLGMNFIIDSNDMPVGIIDSNDMPIGIIDIPN